MLRAVARSGAVADVYVDGVIGEETTAASFREQLAAVKGCKTLRVHINSEGGSVTDGMAIYSALRSFEAKKIGMVEGIAASMGSVILMACDERQIAKGAFIMIHNPSTVVEGGPDELEKGADLMARIRTEMLDIYEARTGMDRAKLEAMVSEETYFTADEAIKVGIADKAIDFEARITLSAVARLGNKIPAALRASAKGKSKMDEEERKAAIAKYKGKIAELEALGEGEDDDEPDKDDEGEGEAEDEAEGEAEDEAEASDDDDTEEPKHDSKKGKKGEAEDEAEAKALIRMVRSLTGKKSLAEATGTLVSLVAKGGATVAAARAEAVNSAVKSGKLPPALKSWALKCTEKTWNAYVRGMGGSAALQLGSKHKQPKGDAPADEPTEAELKIGKAMGLSLEQIKASRALPACAKGSN